LGRTKLQITKKPNNAQAVRIFWINRDVLLERTRAEIILVAGIVEKIRYTDVVGRAPLDTNELRFFQEIVTAKADEIVSKWIDYFVLHKSISSERITKRLK
jgi:hypothetical protein